MGSLEAASRHRCVVIHLAACLPCARAQPSTQLPHPLWKAPFKNQVLTNFSFPSETLCLPSASSVRTVQGIRILSTLLRRPLYSARTTCTPDNRYRTPMRRTRPTHLHNPAMSRHQSHAGLSKMKRIKPLRDNPSHPSTRPWVTTLPFHTPPLPLLLNHNPDTPHHLHI
jgi:hypothetical protein